MIRLAKLSDFRRIRELLAQILFHHHQLRPDIFASSGGKLDETAFTTLINNPNSPVFVYVSEDNVILGHLFVQLKENGNHMRPHKTLYIDDVCVDKQSRGQKIGEQLMAFAEEFAKKENCYNLTLNVWSDNLGAVKFYEHQGLKTRELTMEKIL